jgi:hypothetical protein
VPIFYLYGWNGWKLCNIQMKNGSNPIFGSTTNNNRWFWLQVIFQENIPLLAISDCIINFPTLSSPCLHWKDYAKMSNFLYSHAYHKYSRSKFSSVLESKIPEGESLMYRNFRMLPWAQCSVAMLGKEAIPGKGQMIRQLSTSLKIVLNKISYTHCRSKLNMHKSLAAHNF